MMKQELLEKKKAIYLFSQKGYSYYSFKDRFYKISRNEKEAIPVDRKKKELI